MSINQHMSVAMQRLVDFMSLVTQQYVTTQQSSNAILAGISVGRSIRNSPFPDRVPRGLRDGSLTAVFSIFLDRSRYFFFQVAP
jgi:hypothetical protein